MRMNDARRGCRTTKLLNPHPPHLLVPSPKMRRVIVRSVGCRVASRRLLTKTMHPCRSTATAPVWARDHFQIVAVGVGKIDPASAVVMIDLARAATPRVGPVLETLLTNAAEDGIEISLGNQESVVLWLNGLIGSCEIERHSVVEFDHLEGTESDWRRQPQYLGQKAGGL